jgi:prolipoprotein diacylglyceryl transferase
MIDLVAAININIDPNLIEGGFDLTWHGLFTAVGIAAGVFLSFRLARGKGFSEDDVFTVALVAVPAGIVGARALWVLEHTDQINSFGDIFLLTSGGISIYGAMIGGVLGAMIYVWLFRPRFPKFLALDVAAPGMILGQAVGRWGDLINGEHFADQSSLPWAFRYTHTQTDGPWASYILGDPQEPWMRGDLGNLQAVAPVAVHPVAGGYEWILDFMILGVLLYLRRLGVLPGWSFVFYVIAYAAVRGLLGLLRTDEQMIGVLSVPQLLALITGVMAIGLAVYLLRNPQQRVTDVEAFLEAPPPSSGDDHAPPSQPTGKRPALAAAAPKRVRIRKRRR